MTPYYKNILSSLSKDFKLFLLLKLSSRVWHFSSLDTKEVRRQKQIKNLPITYTCTPIPVTSRFVRLSNLVTFVDITEVLMRMSMLGDLTPCTRPLGRPRRTCEDNIKMDFQKVGSGCGDWMELDQDRDRWRGLVSTVKNFRVP